MKDKRFWGKMLILALIAAALSALLFLSGVVPTVLAGSAAGLAYGFGRTTAKAKALPTDHQQFMEAVESIPLSVLFFDRDDRLIFCNKHYFEMSPVADSVVMGATFEENLRHWVSLGFYPEAEGREDDWIRDRVALHRSVDGSFEYERIIAGMRVWVREHRTPDGGSLVILDDITEHREMEERARELQAELAHISRLRTMGELAAGFAHELNQPLAAINNYVTGVLRRIRTRGGDPSEFVPILESISEQARRGGEIIRNIRAFIRRDEVEKGILDVNETLSAALVMVTGEIRLSGIGLERGLSSPLPVVRGNTTEIQQVILNLIRNSIDALDGQEAPRRIILRTEVTQDGAVRVSVEDTGPGIPEDVRQRLFEPFFTTKAHGMGMGLLICRTIVEGHGSELEIVPGPDGGTVASFRLSPAVVD